MYVSEDLIEYHEAAAEGTVILVYTDIKNKEQCQWYNFISALINPYGDRKDPSIIFGFIKNL